MITLIITAIALSIAIWFYTKPYKKIYKGHVTHVVDIQTGVRIYTIKYHGNKTAHTDTIGNILNDTPIHHLRYLVQKQRLSVKIIEKYTISNGLVAQIFEV